MRRAALPAARPRSTTWRPAIPRPAGPVQAPLPRLTAAAQAPPHPTAHRGPLPGTAVAAPRHHGVAGAAALTARAIALPVRHLHGAAAAAAPRHQTARSPSTAHRQATKGQAVGAPVHHTAAALQRHSQAAAAVLIRLRLPLPRAGAGCASCSLFRAASSCRPCSAAFRYEFLLQALQKFLYINTQCLACVQYDCASIP